ncbi:hypothetical protein O181_042796 [Austropuccinia psidii MF-1]|uniref:Uncharacterized protein n=1 Tax=Austropuccinia psidii MF-1 TaxID=1389203 RepID=A0A9Q3HFF6_9BASI|nr:hypothetical protein [Austropuccinia psidii MF-1]
MMTSSHRVPCLSFVFWPSACPLDSTGYLIGWRKKTAICVATLATDPFVDSHSVLSGLTDTPSKHSSPRILGESSASSTTCLPELRHEGEIWLSLVYANQTLKLRGFEEKTIIVIFYDRPLMRKHRFFSLQPLLKPFHFSDLSHSPEKTKPNYLLAKKIRKFDEAYPQYALSGWGTAAEMSHVIDFINSSQELHDRVHKTAIPAKINQRNAIHQDKKHTSSKTTYYLELLFSLSSFSQQVHVRLIEIFSWPTRYRKITREEDIDLSDCRAEYVMLFNTLWLIANDIIFGSSSATFLMANSERLANWLQYYVETYTVTFVKVALKWTNSYPVGLKLNDQLGHAFCVGSNAAVDIWYIYVLKFAFLALPKTIWITGFASQLGNTFALAIASDFLTIATFHLWIIYRIVTFIFDWQLRFLGVLFNIFRGRKFNVLRGRNEPATYQLDQLILGTILFTLTSFLFPTVLAFYILMGLTRLLIVGLHAIIHTGLYLLNHFPLFVVMLRLKDPARLPAGICFLPQDYQQLTHFRLTNVPVGMTCIFADYISLWAQLTAHYSPRLLFYRFCTGKPIAPLATRPAYRRP